MDPISLALGIVGIGTSIFGGLSQAKVAKEQAQVSQNIFNLQEQQNNVRQQAMEVSGRRQQLEIMRNTQRQRAMGVQAAVSQGAQLGSGLVGGEAEIENEGLFGLQGINQNLQTGKQMFSLSNQISKQRANLASLGGQMATDQGISKLGGDIFGSSGKLGNMATYALGGGLGNSLNSLQLGKLFMPSGALSGGF